MTERQDDTALFQALATIFRCDKIHMPDVFQQLRKLVFSDSEKTEVSNVSQFIQYSHENQAIIVAKMLLKYPGDGLKCINAFNHRETGEDTASKQVLIRILPLADSTNPIFAMFGLEPVDNRTGSYCYIEWLTRLMSFQTIYREINLSDEFIPTNILAMLVNAFEEYNTEDMTTLVETFNESMRHLTQATRELHIDCDAKTFCHAILLYPIPGYYVTSLISHNLAKIFLFARFFVRNMFCDRFAALSAANLRAEYELNKFPIAAASSIFAFFPKTHDFEMSARKRKNNIDTLYNKVTSSTILEASIANLSTPNNAIVIVPKCPGAPVKKRRSRSRNEDKDTRLAELSDLIAKLPVRKRFVVLNTTKRLRKDKPSETSSNATQTVEPVSDAD